MANAVPFPLFLTQEYVMAVLALAETGLGEGMKKGGLRSLLRLKI